MRSSGANPFRLLPAVDVVLSQPVVAELIEMDGRLRVTRWVRSAIRRARHGLALRDEPPQEEALLGEIVKGVVEESRRTARGRLGRVINATGIILHTGLGRAPLSDNAQKAIDSVSAASNVEVDLVTGERLYRGYQLQSLFQSLTGCSDSHVVNNNSAATLLTLQSLCADRDVIISRGQLVEIGGSFRLPDIFELSGARLKEVGTTNRTRLNDYARAIDSNTVAIMRVHPSNYRVVGFEDSVGVKELATLAHEHRLLMIDDIGSGSMIDMSELGLPGEPTFPDSIKAGADIVLGSGDKLLGGPQAGIILSGGLDLTATRQHPLARAFRVGKLTLAALQATLQVYLQEVAVEEIPVLKQLSLPVATLRHRATEVVAAVRRHARTSALSMSISDGVTPVGGGSLPGAEQPTVVLELVHAAMSADECAYALRVGSPHVFCRIQKSATLLDFRSIPESQDADLVAAIGQLADTGNH